MGKTGPNKLPLAPRVQTWKGSWRQEPLSGLDCVVWTETGPSLLRTNSLQRVPYSHLVAGERGRRQAPVRQPVPSGLQSSLRVWKAPGVQLALSGRSETSHAELSAATCSSGPAALATIRSRHDVIGYPCPSNLITDFESGTSRHLFLHPGTIQCSGQY